MVSVEQVEKDVIDFLSKQYTNIEIIRNLWRAAGGDVGIIPTELPPIDIWLSLWDKAKHGASASNVAIVREALHRFPNNKKLIEYLLVTSDATELQIAVKVVEQLEQNQEKQNPETIIDILNQLPHSSEDKTFSYFAPAVSGKLKKSFRDYLTEMLKSAGKGVVEGAKAVIEATAKGVTQALVGTTPPS